MNGSPSAQSVGSLKPSTAASDASGKRARTIIVARNIPEAPVTPVPTSSSSSLLGRHTGTHGAHHHHGNRDIKPVKLNSYAALGSESDVELYERFLSEKKATPHSLDGNPSSGGAVSPQTLVKRRTMGQIPIHSNTSSDSKLESTPVQDTGDAKQRREAVMQHRKWLKSRPIHERLAYERQQNVLKKWKKINREWEEFKARTSKKLGKSEKQLVMSRASEYREQIEMYDALQRALPLSEKVGEDFWLVSLRNDGTRYVPVGNIFSGLFCPIRESSKLQPRVRRPLDYQDTLAATANEEDDGLGHDKPLTILERRSMEALARKKRRLKKQLNALFPHEVEPSQSGQLRVDSVDLFDWASSSQPNEFNDYDNNLLRDPAASTRSLLLPLDEDDQENNADGYNSQRSTARSRQTARSRPKRGPSMRVFLEDPLEDADDNTEAPLELGFFIDIDVPQQKSVFLENNGTTSLQYQWRREDLVDDDLVPRLTKHHPSPLEDPERIAWTSISLREGVVLPGEMVEFVFTFQSKRAGTWLEKWLLDVDPPLPGLSNKRDASACVRLQCTAVDNYVPSTQRKKLGIRAAKAQTQFMAEQVLKHDIIRKVDPYYAIEFTELDESVRFFYDTHRRGAYEDVQYSPRFMTQCHDLYGNALAITRPPASLVSSEEVPAFVTSTPRETSDPPSPFGSFPSDWDLKLTTLKGLVLAADARLESEYMAVMAQQIAEQQAQGADAEDEEDDEEEDLMEKLLGTKARKREEQAAVLRALEPHFHDDFQGFVLAAKVSPYEPRLLTETLTEKFASMAGETPLVLEIARMQSQDPGPADVQACSLLRPLLVRAMDESFAVDQQRERVFEDSKRHFHSVSLSDKKSFADLPTLLSGSESLRSAREKPHVIFLQVDLDIANWFTLSTSSDGSFLEWKLSPKLLDHDTHVPPKVQTAVASISEFLQTVASPTHSTVVVLITELSSPPMNKAMKKLEVAFATSKAAEDKASGDTGDAPPAQPSPIEIDATRQKLEQKRDRQLSLRGVDTVLQRAMSGSGLTIEFLASLDELEVSFHCDKRISSEPLGEGSDVAEGVGLEEASQPQPRVVLVEHLGALARKAVRKPKQIDTASGSATVAPPGADKGKPAAPSAADKKKSVVAAPAIQTPKGISPSTEADEEDDDQIEVLPGPSLEMMAAQALGQRLAQLGDVLVVDFFPQSWWEATFVYFTAPPPSTPSPESANLNEESVSNAEETVVSAVPKHILIGPQLLRTFSTWQSLFQASSTMSTTIRSPMKAVVGGRGLERKLRLMDGLLERVDTIYVVGELAMAIIRVLHTKQVIKAVKRERKPVPRFEGQQLIAAVERLMQKAYRKQVELLLPLDFVVGDTRVDLDMEPIAGDDDGDEVDEEEEEEDEDEDGDDDDSTSRKKKAKQAKFRVQKPLDEPPEIDTWQPRASYDGEGGVVEIKSSSPSSSSWIRFADVTKDTISNVMVVEGSPALLDSAECADDSEPSAASSPKVAALPELDWTFRVFDVGPKSTQALLDQLKQDPSWLFVNGTLGAVEFREFETATKALLHTVQSTPQLAESLLVTGKSTATWLRRLGLPNGKPSPGWTGVVSSTAAKNAPVLSYIVESKQHAMLTAFDSV